MESTIISSLALSPHYIDETFKLIEECFEYSKTNSFKIDFYPLVEKQNHENCFILLENNKVCAHIGVLPIQINVNNSLHPVAFYGGICVASHHQGKGYFRKLFEFANDQFKDVALHFLWSDRLDLYKRYNFFPAINQYQYPASDNNSKIYLKTKLANISEQELSQIKKLYNFPSENRVFRDDAEWNKLKEITSTDLYIKKQNDNILNYFFMGKGEDLDGIIHEYGKITEKDIAELTSYGTVWSSQYFEQYDSETLFGALVKIGNSRSFNEFVNCYTNKFFEIEKVDSNFVHFSFNNNSMSMGHEEFLQGLLGPGSFEELEGIKPLFISGLNSI